MNDNHADREKSKPIADSTVSDVELLKVPSSIRVNWFEFHAASV